MRWTLFFNFFFPDYEIPGIHPKLLSSFNGNINSEFLHWSLCLKHRQNFATKIWSTKAILGIYILIQNKNKIKQTKPTIKNCFLNPVFLVKKFRHGRLLLYSSLIPTSSSQHLICTTVFYFLKFPWGCLSSPPFFTTCLLF